MAEVMVKDLMPRIDINSQENESMQKNKYLNEIKTAIKKSTLELSSVSSEMKGISAQSGWDHFWYKSQNIDIVAHHVHVLSEVQKKSLNMMVLLMNAAGRMKGDYNTIIDLIDSLSKENEGSGEVLVHLLNMKRAIRDLQERDEAINAIAKLTNNLRDVLEGHIHNVDQGQKDIESRFMGVDESIMKVDSKTEKVFNSVSLEQAKIVKGIEKDWSNKEKQLSDFRAEIASISNTVDGINSSMLDLQERTLIVLGKSKQLPWLWTSTFITVLSIITIYILTFLPIL